MSETISFEEWAKIVAGQIEQVTELLSIPLSDNPAELYSQLAAIEPYGSRISTLLAEAGRYLTTSEAIAFNDMGEAKETERKVRLKAATMNQQYIHDVLNGISRAIRSRVMLGANLRKSNVGESNKYAV